MPSYSWLARFRADFERLSPTQQDAFLQAVEQFVNDLRVGGSFRKGLRIKGVKGATGVYELTWADDGRATFEYGQEIDDGQPHVVWRRVGTHGIFKNP
jgi:hypothetical protein